MKMLIKISVCIAMMAVFSLTSCQQKIVTYNDGYDDGNTSTGAPQISGVYDAKSAESPIVAADMEQLIKIEGKNLSNVKYIRFNDVDVDLKQVYAKAKEIYLPVPRALPTEVTNVLTVCTKLGVTTTPFEVKVPDMKIDYLFNEFALPGDTVQVIGNFFDLYGFDTENAVVKLGGVDVKIDSVSASYMSIIIPDGAAENSSVVFSTPSLDAPISIPYRNTDDVLWNLSDPDACGLWAGQSFITTGGGVNDPVMLDKPYFRVKGSWGAWSWNNLPCGNINVSSDIADHKSDYYFVFEVNSNSLNPFYASSAGYIIQLNGGWYVWNPSKDVSFNTYGRWQTIKIPLEEIGGNLSAGSNGMFFIFQPSDAWSVDHSFANHRIIKK
ncbi:MAG: glycan-binding surface protein [Flavobacteriales bacterium]|nr:glycan-binding surface protein [Flavobacteriales bacterium]